MTKRTPRLNRTPYPETVEPDDVRKRNRQLTIGDSGSVSVSIHAPALPDRIHTALLQAARPGFCAEAWCDSQAVTAGRCGPHHAEAVAGMHDAIARLRKTPKKPRKALL